jgi:glycosyltransferase involved in cell wall biosynthesis
MNLLIASVDALPQIGGISLMCHHLANAFSAAGHRVVVVAPKGSYVPGEYQREYLLYEDWGSQVKKREGQAGLSEDERIMKLGTALIERYQIERIILLHPFYYAVGLMDAARAKGIPSSVYFHGFELRSQLRGHYPKSQRTLLAERRLGTLRERIFYTIGTSDEVLVNSAYTASLVEPFPVRPKVRATGCGLPQAVVDREFKESPSYDDAQRQERRRTLGLSPLPTLAFVGRLVVGDGPDRERLEGQVKRHGLGERVRICGLSSEVEKWEILRAASALCLLSEPNDQGGQVEGFGIALLEGAAAGALPVSSGTGGMTDVVAHGRTGFLLSVDDRQAAAELADFLARQDETRRLVTKAREQLCERFTWERVASRILEGWN